MAQATTYKRTMSGSIGAGMSSVFGASGRRYYILEHKTSSQYHRAGESQQIIVDQIELGRASTCQVRFDESFSTVSRRHAAIVKEGDGWKLVQLSHTNSTYLNGQKVQTEWYLRSGDEIQLSTNGPRLGFIVPEGKKGTVGSIGLTRRLSLFRQQALRPYKTALSILSVVLLLLALGGAYKLYDLHSKNKDLAEKAELLTKTIDSLNNLRAIQEDSIKKEVGSLKLNLDSLKTKPKKSMVKNPKSSSVSVSGISNGSYTGLTSLVSPYIYSIKLESIECDYLDGTRQVINNPGNIGATGTAFLLSGGRLVTARHIVEPWVYRNMNIDEMINLQYSNGAAKVVANLVARSPKGDVIHLRSDQFVCERGRDKQITADNGLTYTYAQMGSYLDFGYFQTGKGSGLSYSESENEIHTGNPVYCVTLSGSSPSVFKADITANGISGGFIYTSNSNSGRGRAGGPVFIQKGKNDYVVVGITSSSKGAVIPVGTVTP